MSDISARRKLTATIRQALNDYYACESQITRSRLEICTLERERNEAWNTIENALIDLAKHGEIHPPETEIDYCVVKREKNAAVLIFNSNPTCLPEGLPLSLVAISLAPLLQETALEDIQPALLP